MTKRKPSVSLEKGETENGFSMHVLHERPSKHPAMPPGENILPGVFLFGGETGFFETGTKGDLCYLDGKGREDFGVYESV